MTTVSPPWLTQPLFTPSDAAAVVTSLVFKMAFPNYPGSYLKNAVRAFVISVIARMVPDWTSTYTTLSGPQKNQIVVAALGGIQAAIWKHPILQGMVGQSAIDLIGQEVVALLGINYSPIIDNGKK